jgi:hypothetical protein
MSKIDKIKERINYLKVWLGIFVVTNIGLIGIKWGQATLISSAFLTSNHISIFIANLSACLLCISQKK